MVSQLDISRVRFNIRFLLLATTVLALLFAVWASEIEPYRRQAAGLNRFNETGSPSLNTQQAQSIGLMNDGWKDWLVRSALGESSNVRVFSLEFDPNTPEDDLLFVLERMPFLQSVVLDRCDLSSRAMECLACSPCLTEVQAKYCDVSDEGVAKLAASPTIRRLILSGNPISDDSIEGLSEIESLGELFVRWTKVTETGASEFHRVRPECDIHF